MYLTIFAEQLTILNKDRKKADKLSALFLFVHNECNHFHIFIGIVFHGMPLTNLDGADIAGMYLCFCAVVIHEGTNTIEDVIGSVLRHADASQWSYEALR